MCEFISWIPKAKGNYFLTYHQIFETDKGKEVLEKTKGDWWGHEAINLYYGLSDTERLHKECTDFSTPKNFPDDIVWAIKAGEMKGVFSTDILVMLSPKGKKEYENKCFASAEWSKADAKLNKADAKLNKARAELNKACAEWSKASAEWSKASAELSKADADMFIFWEVFSNTKNRIKAWG